MEWNATTIMTDCKHRKLLGLESKTVERVRCRHCHLTISVSELKGGHCPECLEATGRKRYDFEPVEPAASRLVRYRCEDCGAITGPEPDE